VRICKKIIIISPDHLQKMFFLLQVNLKLIMTKSICIIAAFFLFGTLQSCGPETATEETATEETEQETHVHHAPEPSEEDLNSPKSIPREAHGQVGPTHVTINYYSPGVRDRIIWGGLVAYNQVWVTGAHSATNISFSTPVTIEGELVPAGKYAFFTIPGKESWTVILNKNYQQHLADDYDPKDDVVRIEVSPVEVDFTERLAYDIVEVGENEGRIKVAWEKVGVHLDFKSAN